MAIATASAFRHAIERLRRAWAEIDYAQRRLFEIRTGVSMTRREVD